MSTYRIYGNTEAGFIFSNQTWTNMNNKYIQKRNSFVKKP